MPLIPTQPNSRATTSFNNVSVPRPATVDDNRMPGPVDDAADGQNLSGRKPIIHTMQPRVRNDVSNRPRDIADLPKIP